MKPITDKPLSMIWRFLSVLTRCHVWYFLIVATFIPICSKALSFEIGHDRECISNEIVNVGILDVSNRMFGGLGFEFDDYTLKLPFENGTQAVVFSAVGKPDSPPVREKTAQDCSDKYKNCGLDKLHKSFLFLVGLLIGSIVGNYFGDLYVLRYRSNESLNQRDKRPGMKNKRGLLTVWLKALLAVFDFAFHYCSASQQYRKFPEQCVNDFLISISFREIKMRPEFCDSLR
jgi:hypothetical protein